MNQMSKWRLRMQLSGALVGFVEGNIWGGAGVAIIFLWLEKGIPAIVSAAIAMIALFAHAPAIYIYNRIQQNVLREMQKDIRRSLDEYYDEENNDQ